MKKEIILVLRKIIISFFILAIIVLFIIYVAKIVIDISEDVLSKAIPNYKELLHKQHTKQK